MPEQASLVPDRPIATRWWVLGSLAAGALGLALVYWPIIVGRFRFVSGDIYDGLIMTALLEHWFGVLRGREGPLTPLYFHPFRTTLSYNDGNLISGLIYSVPRALGLDPFLSYELMNWTVRLIGCFSIVAVARLVLKLDFSRALVAGLLLMTVSSLASRMQHAQLLFASFVPLGLLLFVGTFTYLASPDAKRWVQYGAVVGFVGFVFAWAMTAFYSLYVFALLLMLSFGFALALSPDVRRKARFIFTHRFDALVIMAVLAMLAVLMVFRIYGQAQTEGHKVEVVRAFSGRWADLVNVGPVGSLWSTPVSAFYRAMIGEEMQGGEVATGFTPILFIAFCVTVIVLSVRRPSREAKLAAALALACIVIGFLTLKIGMRANWEWFFLYVPGANALRVPSRFLILISPAVILVVVFGLRRLPLIAALALALVMVGEQVRSDLPFGFPRRERIDHIKALPLPPQACRSFYVSEPMAQPTGNDGIDRFYAHSVDAMFLASYFSLPTVNGMATFTPAGWDLHSPLAPDYRARVLAYADRMGTRQGLCALNLKQNRWHVEEAPSR